MRRAVRRRVGLGHVTTLTLEHTVVVFLAPFFGCLTGTDLQTRLVVVLHAGFSASRTVESLSEQC